MTALNVKAMNCTGCGAALQLRAFEHSLTAVCPQCLAILDAKDPNLRVLQEFQGRERVTLQIPLGSRGSWRGATYEVIGFQQRTIEVDSVEYSWHEYLLFNPYHGFRYLTVYNGHWNDVRTVRALPRPVAYTPKHMVSVDGAVYTHFSRSTAVTTYVLGEFPWAARRGDSVGVSDYIAPPLILSSESTDEETTWSRGEYTSAGEIWKAFKLPGAPPRPSGVFANQPSPHIQPAREVWSIAWSFLLIAVAVVALLFVSARNENVFSQSYHFAGGQRETSLVT
ncbi:MAG: DUF4178 domain-containing protein, partial [Bryobacteraceae bacterium]